MILTLNLIKWDTSIFYFKKIIIFINLKQYDNKKAVPKLLNLDEFWGDNSTCQISEPIIFNSLKQIKKGKKLIDNLENLKISNSIKQEKDRRIPIHFKEDDF